MKAILVSPEYFNNIVRRCQVPYSLLNNIYEDARADGEVRYLILTDLHGWVTIPKDYLEQNYKWSDDAHPDFGFVKVTKK